MINGSLFLSQTISENIICVQHYVPNSDLVFLIPDATLQLSIKVFQEWQLCSIYGMLGF